MANWKTYQNGNYTVKVDLDSGTKIRETDEDVFIPSFAECCDVNITNKCDGGCKFCYQGCSIDGTHGNILQYRDFYETLHPYTEIAINGNDLTHPDLIPFLEILKSKKVITNITINQKHFLEKQDFIQKLVSDDLIHGIGVSLQSPTNEFISTIKQYENAVIHVINGIVTESDMLNLAYRGLKLLILGYKPIKRGKTYYQINMDIITGNQKWLKENINNTQKAFKVCGFDNLALEQLDIKSQITSEQWNDLYMGNDGEFTFYIDLCDGTYSKSSLDSDKQKYDMKLANYNINYMFQKIRNETVQDNVISFKGENNNILTVRQISYNETKPFILGIHYARRMPCVQYAYGLFKGEEMIGCVTYGQPPSPSLCKGIAGEENRKNVIELNRLVIMPKYNGENYASYLVGNSLKLLPNKTFVVSYADWGGWNHVGYVYQATNWLYTGLTKARTDKYSASGHSRHYAKDETRRQIRTAKHRYVYLVGDKRTKKQMRKELNYEVLEHYPKGDSRHYDTDNPIGLVS